MWKIAGVLLLALMVDEGFKDQQLKHSRVKSAFEEKEAAVAGLLSKAGLKTGSQIFIRAFKKERTLEVWGKEKTEGTFTLITTYPFCTSSGILGPKRKEGDLQIPEGVYQINHFNPVSTFHLSLGINYPNQSDRILGDKHSPGGAIYIHGNCVSIGCIPITDEKIKELYIMAVDARQHGQERIPVHIFPFKMNDETMKSVAGEFSESPATVAFWKMLQPVYTDFEKNHVLKSVKVLSSGSYALQ